MTSSSIFFTRTKKKREKTQSFHNRLIRIGRRVAVITNTISVTVRAAVIVVIPGRGRAAAASVVIGVVI